MSKINVTSLRPRSLLRWTGLTVKVFIVLVGRVAALLPKPGRGHPWVLLLDNRVLLAAIAWRTNLTHPQLADLLGVGIATVHRVIDRITPWSPGSSNPEESRADLWVVDGTLIPVEEHAVTACSKNYRRSVHIQLTFRARDRRVIAVGDSWPGNRKDIVVSAPPGRAGRRAPPADRRRRLPQRPRGHHQPQQEQGIR
ncbi:hypothetical protein [Streptomyces spiramyceticus]|uniref:hypothetical protein n=1 Tax=Streptomyces spiramyceticus TaxID=299717 RepID=UPI00237AF593|nr:hypothetical protein [Streptomyces spiramyceticus]